MAQNFKLDIKKKKKGYQYPIRKLFLEGCLVPCLTEVYLMFVCDISPTESKIFMVILLGAGALGQPRGMV